MASLIQELENNEAMLLMYLADELPAEDRVEVEQMLANDPGLRADLARIESAYTAAMGALATLDADRTAIPGENHALRQASRAMKQWQVDRLVRQPVAAPAIRSRVPTWAYPAGVAAMLLIGSLIWWGGQNDAVVPPSKVASGTDAALAAPIPGAVQLLKNLTGDLPGGDGIDKAETQASSLVASSDNDSAASSIFLNNGNQ